MSIMGVCGVDPGKTSGIVLLLNGQVAIAREAKSLLALFNLLIAFEPAVLVVEDFVPGFRWRSRNANDPLKAVGVFLVIFFPHQMLCYSGLFQLSFHVREETI